MTQTWDAQAYGLNGAFVYELAGGVLEWLNAQMGEFILDLGCGDGQLTQRLAATGAAARPARTDRPSGGAASRWRPPPLHLAR